MHYRKIAYQLLTISAFLFVLFLGCQDEPHIPEIKEYTVSGTVIMAGTTEGIEGIDVTIVPEDATKTTTNENGTYILSGLIEGKNYTIKANAGRINAAYTEDEFRIEQINANETNADMSIMTTRGDVTGFVTNALNNEPLEGVRVTITPGNESRNTGSDGIYTFDELREIDYSLQFTKAGFETNNKSLTVQAGQTQNGDIALMPIAPIQVDPSQLNFGTSISSQTIKIKNETSETLNFEIQAPNDWVIPERDQGVIPGLNSELVKIDVKRSNLPVGSHVGQIVVNIPGRGTRSVEIFVEKLDAAAAVLRLDSEGTLNFGSTISERTISISNIGDHTLNWGLNVTKDWLSTTQQDGSLPPDDSEEIRVLIDRSDLTDGTYDARIDFTSNGGNGSIFVIMEVRSDNSGGGEMVVTSGLRAYFTFDDGTGKDEQENFQAIPIGAQTSADTPTGSGLAMSFDGDGDYLQLSGNPIRNTNLETIHGTVSFWVKSVSGGTVFAIPYLNNNSYNEFLIALKPDRITHSLDNTADGRWCCTEEGRFDLNMNSLVLNDTWHMITLTYDGATDNVYLYFDGTRLDLDGAELAYKAGIGAEISRIGRDYYSGTNEVIGADDFNGLLDNIRFYSRPLTASEVQEIFDARQ